MTKNDLTPLGIAAASTAIPQYLHPNNNLNSPQVEGLLYNWAAATNRKGGVDGTKIFPEESENGTTNIEQVGVQGICPRGWHLPSDLEWNRLEKEITNNRDKYATYTGASFAWHDEWNTLSGVVQRGGHQKLMRSTSGPNVQPGYSKPASSGGFDVLGVGNFVTTEPADYTYGSLFWTSSAPEGESERSWMRKLYNTNIDGIFRVHDARSLLNSVRCKRNK